MRMLILSLCLSIFSPFAMALDPVLEAADLRNPEAPAISAAAAAKRPKRRVLAASALGRIMSPKGIDLLLRLTADPMPFVREEAAFALGQLGWQEESSGGRLAEIQAALTGLLSDKQPGVRLAAVEALGKTSLEKAPELLAPAFASKNAPVRAAAVMALFRARMILKLRNPAAPPGELPEELRGRLEALAADKDASVRQNTAYFFARNSEPKAEKAVAALLADKNRWTRMFAAMGLSKMKAKSSKRELVHASGDPDYQVRLAALSALLASGESALEVPALADDKSFHLRAAFAAGLDPTKETEAGVLLNLLKDASPTVRAEAVKAAAKGKGEGLQAWLREQGRQAHWLVREATVHASSGLPESERASFLADHLGDSEIAVRAAALEALLALPGQASYAELKKSLESPELAIRGIAVSALKERKEKEAPELAWKAYNSSLDQKWIEMREELSEIFAKVEGEEGTDFLRKLLQDPASSVRAKARKALQARGLTDIPVYPEPALSRSPHRNLSFSRAPLVRMETNRGTFTVETYPHSAPVHVGDFVGNVKAGYYDGLSWHRVVSNFVVQGGDPDGSGWGGAGYALRAEINRQPFLRGALGMPRSQGFDTGGSQLFFSPIPVPHLDGQYTVFGIVVEGIEVLDRLERGDKILSAKVIHMK
jgi:cyclophilin family peptidyl-prolyl cis-trans isomerase/HEAT repeat protein